MSEELGIELEALRATYDSALAIRSEAPLTLAVALAPHDCPAFPPEVVKGYHAAPGGGSSFSAAAEQEARCFVRVTLVLQPGAGYPDSLPGIRLEGARGATHRGIRPPSVSQAVEAWRSCAVLCEVPVYLSI